MKLSKLNKQLKSGWVKRKAKIGDIIRYKSPSQTYYCRVRDIRHNCYYGHYVEDIKDVDKIEMNDGCVPINSTEVLK